MSHFLDDKKVCKCHTRSAHFWQAAHKQHMPYPRTNKSRARKNDHLVFLITLSYVALSRIPFNEHDTNPRIGEGVGGEITCSCSACERWTKRMSEDSSFTFNMYDGICHLWLYSFEDLSTNLRSSLGKKLG